MSKLSLEKLSFDWRKPVDAKYSQWVLCPVVGNGYEEPYRPLIARVNEAYDKINGAPKYDASFSTVYQLDPERKWNESKPYLFCIVRIDSETPQHIDSNDVIDQLDSDEKWQSLLTHYPCLAKKLLNDVDFDEVLRNLVVDPDDTRQYDPSATLAFGMELHDPVEQRYFMNNGTTVTVHGLTLSNLSTTSPAQTVCYMNANITTGSGTGSICVNVIVRSNTGGSGANTTVGTNVGAIACASNVAIKYQTVTWTPGANISLNYNDAVLIEMKVNAITTYVNKQWITLAFTCAAFIPNNTWTFNYQYAFNVNATATRMRFSYGASTNLSGITNFTWTQFATYTKTFSANAELIGTLTKTFSAGAELQPQTNWSGTLNAGNYTITVPTNVTINSVNYAFVNWEDSSTNLTRTVNLNANTTITATYAAPGGTKTFSLNAELIKNLTKTFSANAELLKSQTKTFTVNAELLKSLSKTFSANAELLKSLTKAFTANAELLKSQTKTFTVAAELQLAGQSKSFTVNAELTKTLTKTFTAGAELQVGVISYTKTFSANAELKGILLKAFTVSAELWDGITPPVTTTGGKRRYYMPPLPPKLILNPELARLLREYLELKLQNEPT